MLAILVWTAMQLQLCSCACVRTLPRCLIVVIAANLCFASFRRLASSTALPSVTAACVAHTTRIQDVTRPASRFEMV